MPDPAVSALLAHARRPLLSYEFFPPKDEVGLATVQKVAEALCTTRPDFVSVTYGAGGSTQARTLQVCERLQSIGMGPVVHHLTCVGATRQALEQSITQIMEYGIRNIMALRGDPPRGESRFHRPADGLAHAVELVKLIKQRYPDCCCGVAGYPETHQEALSPESDLLYLKDKVEAGGAFVTTQLFYDNSVFFQFERRCREWGIRAPIIPGLLPPISLNQLHRMAHMCNSRIPPALLKRMEDADAQPEKAEAVGIEWTVAQIQELLRHGVPGIHLYILNRSKAALAPALKSCFDR